MTTDKAVYVCFLAKGNHRSPREPPAVATNHVSVRGATSTRKSGMDPDESPFVGCNKVARENYRRRV